MYYFLLVLGLAMIIKSADVLIDSSAKIAKHLGVSTFIIGITVIAFGTSAPELAVGVISGASHANQLTLGNVIGSSLANTALIAGSSAIITGIRVKDSVVKREIPILLGIQISLAAMIFTGDELSRIEGIVLLIAFIGFLYYIVNGSKSSVEMQFEEGDSKQPPNDEGDTKPEKLQKHICFSILSLVGLFIGGKLTVESSTSIAQSLGLSETLIGLTVVSIATTMPELITSIMAAVKKEPDIVLGNCIGSNIINILLVLGLSTAISPIPTDAGLYFDVAATIAVTVFIFAVAWTKKQIKRRSGILLSVFYVLYLAYKVISVL